MNKWSSHKEMKNSVDAEVLGRAAPATTSASPLGDTFEAIDRPQWAWKSTLIVLGLGLIGLLLLFGETATGIAQVWWKNDAYGHGLFIVPITLFLIWRSRHRLGTMTPSPTVWGIAALAIAAFTWLLGNVAGIVVVEQFSLVLMLQALILSVVGWRVIRATLFPIFFLLFAVPFGEFLIPPLQDFTALFTVRALQISGIPVFLEGLYIQIPAATFEVAATCSGARFLIASVTLGSLFANQFYQQTRRRVLFMALAVLVPIIANGFRAYGLVMIAHLSGLELAVGADHLTFGLIFLSIVIVLLLLLGSLFREKRVDDVATPTKTNGQPGRAITVLRLPKLIGTTLAAILVAGSAAAYVPFIENRSIEQAATIALMPPVVGAEWRQVTDTQSGWHPKFYGASEEQLWFYEKANQAIEVYAAFYPYQSHDLEIVGWRNRLADGKVWQELTTADRTAVELEGNAQGVQRIHLRSRAGRKLVLYWYWIDGRFEADPRIAKLRQLKTQLMGGDQSAAFIAVATNYSDRPDGAMDRLRSFIAGSPSFKSIVAGIQPADKPKVANSSLTPCPEGEPCAE